MTKRMIRLFSAVAALAALALGGSAIASAFQGQPDRPDATSEAAEPNEAAESNEAAEPNEAAEADEGSEADRGEGPSGRGAGGRAREVGGARGDRRRGDLGAAGRARERRARRAD